MPFLPVKLEELGGKAPDFVLLTTEAYVDHPSFGHAIIGRLVESKGFTVAILPQPQSDADYRRFGSPSYGFLVSGGAVDSMVNNYTVAKNKRSRDEYSEGGATGRRPDRAVTVYSKNLKRLFPNVPVIIGGMEASLRRFAHYDYWADKVMPSILVDSLADLLIYGMGERPMWDILALIAKGVPIKSIKDVAGTAYLLDYNTLSDTKKATFSADYAFCPSFEDTVRDKKQFMKAYKAQTANANYLSSRPLAQKTGERYVIANVPQKPLTSTELDGVYALPFMGDPHPMYAGGVPSIEEVRFSVTAQRGCFGNCSYCALCYHQGRSISKRSKDSIVLEVKKLSERPDFKGYIHDIGAPTANFRNPSCDKQLTHGVCPNKQCIGTEVCENLKVDHSEYLDILRTCRALPNIKKVFIRSGVRFDYVMLDKNQDFIKELIEHHVSGQLKVAPEHSVPEVLRLMNKPDFAVFKAFSKRFYDISARAGKEQYLVPYLISSHPGCTEEDALKLTDYLREARCVPEQVQDFYPTPSTRSTAMFYCETDMDGTPIFVAKSGEEKKKQRALLQYGKPQNQKVFAQANLKRERYTKPKKGGK